MWGEIGFMLDKEEKNIEKKFIDTYIVKSRKDRIFYELCNKKKRIHAIGRFCHTTVDYVKETCISYSGNKISREELLELIQKNNQNKCYVISWALI